MDKNVQKNLLVTGGAGYLGSHMVRLLIEEGFTPVVFDNLSTGHREFIPQGTLFIEGDLRRKEEIHDAFRRIPIAAVLHFAASSIVSESGQNPLKYYANNVLSAVNLLEMMRRHHIKKFIFSSTAAVYGAGSSAPLREEDPTVPANVYGRSKLMVEQVLKDAAGEDEGLSYISLRYFNACGAHPQAQIGEWHDPETHLIPGVLRAASGRRNEVAVYGNDYPTPDGTCIRDYVHVDDLCRAHLLALKALQGGLRNEAFNLGSGEGFSVMEVIEEAENVTGKPLRARIKPRRPGDPPVLVASYEKADRVLGWQPKIGLREIIRTAWDWELDQRAAREEEMALA